MSEHLKARIEAKSVPEPNSGCWLWIGSISDQKREPRFHRLKAILSNHETVGAGASIFQCTAAEVEAARAAIAKSES